MKVNVLTVDEVKIKKWRWWSNWIDVACFDYAQSGYLLQMKISRNNAKKFRHIPLRGFGISHPGCGSIGDLTQMKG